MNVSYRIDSNTGQGTFFPLSLYSPGSDWGFATFGVNTWGGGFSEL